MDDGSPIGFLLLIVFLILASAFFSASETALASVNRIRIKSLSENDDKRAKRVLYILDHFDQALTTILIGNNIVNISCASAATVMATRLWGLSAVTVTTIVVTLVLFLFAEALPKRFAIVCSERIALAISGSILFLMKLLTPIAKGFSVISNAASKPFRKKTVAPTVTEDELYDIMETVAAEGALDEEKTGLMQSALEFSGTTARDVLTPWADVVRLSVAMEENEILRIVCDCTHSRLPVVDVHGAVIGILQIRKYLKAHLKGHAPLMKIADPPQFIDADMPIDDLLPLMSAHKTQLALVRDTKEHTLGVVSVEDILEELVGEIYDEEDPAERSGS